jgi:vancomycin resistance protein YoaR
MKRTILIVLSAALMVAAASAQNSAPTTNAAAPTAQATPSTTSQAKTLNATAAATAIEPLSELEMLRIRLLDSEYTITMQHAELVKANYQSYMASLKKRHNVPDDATYDSIAGGFVKVQAKAAPTEPATPKH